MQVWFDEFVDGAFVVLMSERHKEVMYAVTFSNEEINGKKIVSAKNLDNYDLKFFVESVVHTYNFINIYK